MTFWRVTRHFWEEHFLPTFVKLSKVTFEILIFSSRVFSECFWKSRQTDDDKEIALLTRTWLDGLWARCSVWRCPPTQSLRSGQLLQSLTTLSSQENMQDIDYQQNFLGFCGVLLQFCPPHTVPQYTVLGGGGEGRGPGNQILIWNLHKSPPPQKKRNNLSLLKNNTTAGIFI